MNQQSQVPRDTIQLHRGDDGKVRIAVLRGGKLCYWNGWGLALDDTRTPDEVRVLVEGLLRDAVMFAGSAVDLKVPSIDAEELKKANADFDAHAQRRAKQLLSYPDDPGAIVLNDPAFRRMLETAFCLGYKAGVVDLGREQRQQASSEKP